MEFLLVVCVIGAVICGMVLKNVKGKKDKTIAGIVLAGCIFGFFMIMIASWVPYNPASARQKAEEQREEQWLQDNFGNGQYEDIQNAIDDYKSY